MRDDSSHAGDVACRRVVRALIEKYDWTLVGEDDLLALVLGSTQSEATPAELEKLAKHHYTIVLYQACRGAEDPGRREQGYHELFRYLFRSAYNRWPELAEDATQRAMVLVYEQIDRCQNPGTFLAFALYKLLQAFKEEQRSRGKEDSPLSSAVDPALVQSHLGQQERLQVLVDAITRLPDERQQRAILLKFFGGLSDEAIGARLQITAGHVRVLRHRGLTQLRRDKQLRDYFEDESSEET